MSVNLVTLGMFYSLAVFAYVPGANPILSIVLAAIAVTFLAVAYSGLIAAMPRAGGDYIWQSRVLDGIPGILTGAVVGGVAGYLVGQAVGPGSDAGARERASSASSSAVRSASSMAASASSWRPPAGGSSSRCGRRSTARSSTSSSSSRSRPWSSPPTACRSSRRNNGILFVSIVTIVLTSALVALGMAGYARIQKWCLYLGLIGFAIMVVLMLIIGQADFKAAFDRANENLFGVAGAYDKTLADAAVNDAWVPTLAPTDLGREHRRTP